MDVLGNGAVSAERPVIEWCAAQRAKKGEVESGDQYAISISPEGTFVAVIDGLGHGAEAAMAARQAVNTVKACTDQDTVALMRRCHTALTGTRGAVIGLARFRAEESGMEWLSIGNIAGIVVRAQTTTGSPIKPLLARGGIVGYRLPTLAISTVPLRRDDLVILATDGIRGDFVDDLTTGKPAQALADRILAQYGTESDDALLLVVRYLGRGPETIAGKISTR